MTVIVQFRSGSAKLSAPENPNVYGVPMSMDDNTDFFFDYNSGSIRAHERTRWRRSNAVANNETRDDDDITFDVSADQVGSSYDIEFNFFFK